MTSVKQLAKLICQDMVYRFIKADGFFAHESGSESVGSWLPVPFLSALMTQ